MEKAEIYGLDFMTLPDSLRTYLDGRPIYGEIETIYYPESRYVRVEGHLNAPKNLPSGYPSHVYFHQLPEGFSCDLAISYQSAAKPVKVILESKEVSERIGSATAGPHKYYLLFKVSDDQAQPVTKLPWLRLLRYRIKAWWPW